MTVDRRRLVLFGLLFVMLAFAVLKSPFTAGLFARKPPPPRAPQPATLQTQAAAPRSEAPKLAEEELADWRRRFARSWRRDPFFTLEEEQAHRARKPAPRPTPGPSPPASASLPSYTVRLVLISGTSKLAAINGRLVSEGEMLGEERVAEILPNAVILERAGERRKVEIAGGNVPLREER